MGNPGAVVLGGRVVGLWTVRTRGDRLDAAVTLFEDLPAPRRSALAELAERCAAFREKRLDGWQVC